ncbi:sensor histidine kinase [Crossiella cryophila]|uniref:histidine kinase n=1 Tax=Crossiella cryophila TaxID=43355 RepID=A0A7W7FWZ4_9PSEU|nr:histidine kinase [Crossiella cryophila]MBB4680108.1 signal transduction histidine kinase [Crossiella cryophila]
MTPPAAPDAFERWYSALMKPVGRTRWTLADLLITGLVGFGSLDNALTPTTGLLSGAVPAAAVAFLVTLGFLWRRQAPLAVAVLAMAGLIIDGARTPVFFALFGLAAYQRRHRSAIITITSAVVIPLKALLPGSTGHSVTTDLLTSAFYVLMPVVFGLGARAYERGIVTLRAERERQIAQTKAAERIRLAREMHDILGHRIATIAMHAGALEFVPGVKPESRQVARVIGDTARAGLRDLRQVLGALRTGDDSVIAGRRLADLEQLVANARSAGLDITFTTNAADPVPPEIALTAYRTVQEALTNVIKHAPAARTEVRVAIAAGTLETLVRNAPSPVPGRRIKVAGAGFGMIGLRERVCLLGGSFHAEPTEDGGWQVLASVPLNDPAGQQRSWQ